MLDIVSNREDEKKPKVYVVGVGGGGNNAVNRISERVAFPVSYYAINTDEAVLAKSVVNNRIQIGIKLTKGFGTGGSAEIGRSAAEESDEEIMEELRDANMVILTCGMGGGTGTGATPVIAQMCKKAGILTMAVVTTPFSFENKARYAQAELGIAELRENVDMLITIRNDRLIEMSERPITVETAFQMADEALAKVIEGVTSIIFRIGTVNLDFNDLAATLRDSGDGNLGIGRGTIEESVMDIVQRAVNSPLMEGDISGATRILINTSGQVDLRQLQEAVHYINSLVDPNASVMWGTVENTEDENEIVVTFIAAGVKMWDHKIEPIVRTSVKQQYSTQASFLTGYANVSASAGRKPVSQPVSGVSQVSQGVSTPTVSALDISKVQPAGKKITKEEFEEKMRILKNQQSVSGMGQTRGTYGSGFPRGNRADSGRELKNPLEQIGARTVVVAGEKNQVKQQVSTGVQSNGLDREIKPVIPEVFLKTTSESY